MSGFQRVGHAFVSSSRSQSAANCVDTGSIFTAAPWKYLSEEQLEKEVCDTHHHHHYKEAAVKQGMEEGNTHTHNSRFL